MQVKKTRYYWVDVTKAIGIFLVYYVHVLQRTYHFSTDAIFFQYKLNYAFHMPMFFFISGFFYKNAQGPAITKIGVLFQKRIFPVLLFGAISLLIWPIYMFFKFGTVDIKFLASEISGYLIGQPGLNVTLWFLVCLFMTEVWAILLLPKIKTVWQGILLSLFFMLVGHSLRLRTDIFLILPKNFWYIHESILTFGLYTLGYSTFRWLKKLVSLNILIRLLLIPILSWLLVLSVNLNVPEENFVMVMKFSEHGNLYFFLSFFAGTLLTILIASLMPKLALFNYIGKNTLILLGTNGIFVSFFYSHIIDWLNHYHSTLWVIFDSFWLSVLTILLSVPVVSVLNKYLPQLVGRPQVDGPIFKAILPPEYRNIRQYYDKISQKLGNIR